MNKKCGNCKYNTIAIVNGELTIWCIKDAKESGDYDFLFRGGKKVELEQNSCNK